MIHKRKQRVSQERSDLFDGLPDDIILSILCKLSSTARCPSDFINILLTCKRLNRLGLYPLVLSRADSKAFSIKANNWSESAHRFLRQCVNSGNIEACYTLGMIRYYCLKNRRSGASLMAKAATKSHAPSLYSLAVIQFNGSGGSKDDKDLRAGVALCARAAYLGHIDALRELGYCFQDGYGVSQNVAEGRRLLVQANARELACVLRAAVPSSSGLVTWLCQNQPAVVGSYVPARDVHPAHRFLTEWFGLRDNGSGQELRVCSQSGCGRTETRRNEFRRCSVCGTVNYCSRGCQALDWKLRHKVECASMAHWIDPDGGDGNDRMVEIDEA